MMPTLLNTLSPSPRARRWGKDAFAAVLAAILLVLLFTGCQSSPKRPPHPSGPDFPFNGPVLPDPVTDEAPNVRLP